MENLHVPRLEGHDLPLSAYEARSFLGRLVATRAWGDAGTSRSKIPSGKNGSCAKHEHGTNHAGRSAS
jgi:hypothetical protein